jgi:hypothetical protein
MEQQKAIKPQAYENLHEAIKADYRRLMISMNGSWNTPEDREEARQTLAKSLKNANHAVQELAETQDVELRRLHDALILQTVLAEGAVRDPRTLKR